MQKSTQQEIRQVSEAVRQAMADNQSQFAAINEAVQKAKEVDQLQFAFINDHLKQIMALIVGTISSATNS